MRNDNNVCRLETKERGKFWLSLLSSTYFLRSERTRTEERRYEEKEKGGPHPFYNSQDRLPRVHPHQPSHLFRFCFKSTWRNSRARTNFFKGVKTPECRRKDFILHFKFSSRRNYLFYNSQRMGWRRLPNVYIAEKWQECHLLTPSAQYASLYTI